VDIIDGLGMTEMLHIFLSNQPGRVKAGTTGVAVPGYDLRLLDEDGRLVIRQADHRGVGHVGVAEQDRLQLGRGAPGTGVLIESGVRRPIRWRS
jgi:acyl-coenzyme A synthetase/AMP-(fatty) acid ligase